MQSNLEVSTSRGVRSGNSGRPSNGWHSRGIHPPRFGTRSPGRPGEQCRPKRRLAKAIARATQEQGHHLARHARRRKGRTRKRPRPTHVAVTEILLHRSVEVRNARSKGMRDREACSQVSSNAKRRREQSSGISRQWMSRAPETHSVTAAERSESQCGDRISMWKARRNGVIFAWKRGSQASSFA